jgi:hypothetical protein
MIYLFIYLFNWKQIVYNCGPTLFGMRNRIQTIWPNRNSLNIKTVNSKKNVGLVCYLSFYLGSRMKKCSDPERQKVGIRIPDQE